MTGSWSRRRFCVGVIPAAIGLAVIPRRIAAAGSPTVSVTVEVITPTFHDSTLVTVDPLAIIEQQGVTCGSDGTIGATWPIEGNTVLAALERAFGIFSLSRIVEYFPPYAGLYVHEIEGLRARCDAFIGWQCQVNGVPIAQAMDQVYLVNDDRVLVFPFGFPTGVPVPSQECAQCLRLQATPNPADDLVVLTFTSPGQFNTGELTLTDVAGRIWAEFTRPVHRSSANAVYRWDARFVPPGVYFARLVVDGHLLVSTKVVILR